MYRYVSAYHGETTILRGLILTGQPYSSGSLSPTPDRHRPWRSASTTFLNDVYGNVLYIKKSNTKADQSN